MCRKTRGLRIANPQCAIIPLKGKGDISMEKLSVHERGHLFGKKYKEAFQ